MTINYKWSVNQLDCYPTRNDKVNVVAKVHWTVIGLENDLSARVSGCTTLKLDNNEPFTQYDQLTPEQVVSWVKHTISHDTETTDPEETIQRLIQQKKTPSIIKPQLPWQNQ